ncbi:FMN-binding negative transcriptional regulator [Algoriphagus halophilus]|uniref:Negative transcriptional regulator, PaiB family n=1 Tax=Algoriphagus halophilus TaxID=226505 RepID=A0A1N6DBN9_9BACT|nr:FMN-binding negative transcriptional regulator [Algoriphagus halophilus]SIN68074.1 negative transcriptional regulator, PaiB family [Algoriphagus halophilus]
MYIHPINRWENEEEITNLIQQNPFATMVSKVDGRPWATHLPLLLSKDKNGDAVLSGHVAKANQQWKHLGEEEVLVLFQGPHAYISSSWYNHENVPTWNYLAVHIYGNIRIIEGDELMEHLKSLVHTFEAGRPHAVTVEGMSEKYLNSQLKGLIGVEIKINEVQASAKLSQNRDETNYQNIITHLEHSPYPLDQEVAKEMVKRKKK